MNAINHPFFSIYRKLSSNRQQKKEAEDIWWFLNSLCKLMTIDDVEYGSEPPDFIFHVSEKLIGVELTKLDPKIFVDGGYTTRKFFKEWEKEANTNPQPYREFPWGEFSVRDSLAAFSRQFQEKRDDLKRWKENFSERWLLAHIDKGSPFGEIFPAAERITPGREEDCANHKAKIIYSLASICGKPHAFDYVIFFSGPNLFPFPVNGRNPHKLPLAKPEVLEQGAKASDTFLDWRISTKSCKKQISSEEIESGKLNSIL
ncbi:MAG TPA: hypothetical protein VFV23_11840 [Verrucomicrobiae bacterium]|nr:hypothetical protein [Verrucomicrobiae bacterium]